jgi:hypothetical protein
MTNKTLSPLKAKPLRNPGQSVEQAIDDLFADKLIPYYFVPMFFWVIAGIEWFSMLTELPRQPVLYTGTAVLLSVVGGVRLWQLRARVRALKLGRDGERAVGQFLDGLREHGARIFHDIPGAGFNLDHVVVSPRGIFAVETKTLSKKTPRSVITIDKDEILVAGRRIDRNPIEQVREQVRWLARLLEESTGKRLPVKGAVVFPGWFVEPPHDVSALDVWVLEPKALPAFIEHEPVRLRTEDVALAAFHLSRYIRAS